MLTLTTPFPRRVAPMNCQKGIMNAPQHSPHKSNAALGLQHPQCAVRVKCKESTQGC